MGIDRVPVRGTWWRQVAAGLDPLALRDPPGDGRWQRGNVVGGTYLADAEATVWAEWYRTLAEAALPPRVWLPCALWRVEVAVDDVADLTSERGLRGAGLELPVPGRSSWPPFQTVGERLRGEGFSGVLAPSGARPAGMVLCLFRPGPAPLLGVCPLGPPRRVEDPPALPRGMRT